MKTRFQTLATLGALALLTACGGSSSDRVLDATPPTHQGPGTPSAILADTTIETEKLSFPDAPHMPVTSRNGTYRVGAPAAPPTATTNEITRRGTTVVHHAAVADGTPRNDIARYLEMTAQVLPQVTIFSPEEPLSISIAPNARAELTPYIVRAVQLINATLPPASRWNMIARPGPPYGQSHTAEPYEIPIAYGNLSPGIAGIAETGGSDGRRIRGNIRINRTDTYARIGSARTAQARQDAEDQLMAALVHELLHVAGIDGHPDRDVFPESVMAYSLAWNKTLTH